MAALPGDVVRAGESAKHAYETVFKAMVELLQRGSRVSIRIARSRWRSRRCVWAEWSSPEQATVELLLMRSEMRAWRWRCGWPVGMTAHVRANPDLPDAPPKSQPHMRHRLDRALHLQ
jgi:hypothetical protein